MIDVWFKYGDLNELQLEIEQSMKVIDIECWLVVIPQIIPKLNITNKIIQKSIQDLLLNVAFQNPQSLIFPLLVAKKSKSNQRRQTAFIILTALERKFPDLIKQASLISDELNKVAILLEEEWYEGIDEACKYFLEDSEKLMYDILSELHQGMHREPQSQNERTFYQKYQNSISQAEAYLRLYRKTHTKIVIYQAWEIYSQLFKQIYENISSLTEIFLKNVSTKLLACKNCDVAIPGQYAVNRPIVKIAGFHSYLTVLISKRRPRK